MYMRRREKRRGGEGRKEEEYSLLIIYIMRLPRPSVVIIIAGIRACRRYSVVGSIIVSPCTVRPAESGGIRRGRWVRSWAIWTDDSFPSVNMTLIVVLIAIEAGMVIKIHRLPVRASSPLVLLRYVAETMTFPITVDCIVVVIGSLSWRVVLIYFWRGASASIVQRVELGV